MNTSEVIATLNSHQVIQAMSHESFNHDFMGFGIHPSKISVHIFEYEGWKLVVFQDLGIGTSVTNASEQLATKIARLKNLDHEKTIWLECYPYYGGDYDIDQIIYRYDKVSGQYSNPDWKPIRNTVVVDFIRNTIKA